MIVRPEGVADACARRREVLGLGHAGVEVREGRRRQLQRVGVRSGRRKAIDRLGAEPCAEREGVAAGGAYVDRLVRVVGEVERPVPDSEAFRPDPRVIVAPFSKRLIWFDEALRFRSSAATWFAYSIALYDEYAWPLMFGRRN